MRSAARVQTKHLDRATGLSPRTRAYLCFATTAHLGWRREVRFGARLTFVTQARR